MATTALALYPYDEEIVKDIFQPSDLTFPAGGVITNIQQHESGWWEGTHGSQRGTFPAVLVSTNVIGRAKCIHPYYAERLDELNIRKGDDVEIYERRQSGWLRVIVNGKGGLVPSTHVREMRAGVQHAGGFPSPSMEHASVPKQPRMNSPVAARSPQMKAKPVCPPSLSGNMNHSPSGMAAPSAMAGPPSPATVGPPPPATVGPPPMGAMPAATVKVNKFPSPASSSVRMPTAAAVHTPAPAPTPLPQAVAVAPPTSKSPSDFDLLVCVC